uniref:Uncharacterized protein n=1 Tax=Triticum urartu TaxID=4572 RepID=A0A8R7TC28_TRIUA
WWRWIRWFTTGGGVVVWNEDVVDPFKAASDADVANHREEDEVGVDPALNLPEPVGGPAGHDELVGGAPPLAGHDELMGVPEHVAQPGQRPRGSLQFGKLDVRQQLRDHEDPARQLLALRPVLPSRQRGLHGHGDEPADVRTHQLRHRRRLAQPGQQRHGG